MAISDSQKVDLLYKKIAWAVAKTDTNPPKEAYNETNPSPLLIRGDILWQLSGSIPASIPTATSSIVQVYKDGGGSYSATVECTELAVTDNRTWSTGLTDWISQEFGSTYFVKVYIDTAGSTTPQTTGTSLQAAGVNDDQWFFDYQAGILNFIGTNLPTAITTGVTGKSIFISGARYVGPKGVTSWSNGLTIGNVIINGNTITGNTGVTFGGNITTANIILTNNLFWSNGISALAPTYGNTQVAQYLPVYTGNIGAGNVNITGNVNASYVLGDGSKLTNMPIGYANVDVAAYLTIYSGNINSGNVTTTGNIRGNIFADIITPYQTSITTFNSSSAIGLPVGDNSTRPTGVAGYFRYSTAGLAPEYYNGTTWVSVSNTTTAQSFSGDGVNTTYALDQTTNQSGVLVSINGTLQQPGVAYTVAGNQITFSEIPLTTDVIDVRFLGSLVNALTTYSNTNVAAYLTTATISTTGNVSANVLTANTLIVGGDLAVTGNVAGSNLTSKTTGSWTVATGTNTYSITVPASGTYQIWVRGNIPNGIITYIATAVVTNTNVPVVGVQYAWVYNGGGTPIDFTSIPNQFTGTGNTIVRSSTAPSATTNRFDFGISNTSGSSQTVYWGYVTLG